MKTQLDDSSKSAILAELRLYLDDEAKYQEIESILRRSEGRVWAQLEAELKAAREAKLAAERSREADLREAKREMAEIMKSAIRVRVVHVFGWRIQIQRERAA